MKQSSPKRKPRLYPTAEEDGLGCGAKVAESLAVYTPKRRRTVSVRHS